ncbi:MAG: hypothetical protein ACUVSF_05305 [Anaerolineae bacterium]
MPSQLKQIEAIQEFDRLRERAILAELVSLITRSEVGLLPFDVVREKLHVHEVGERGLQDIPLDKIVGSVGRYNDFTRHFLPRTSSIRQRWARVRSLAEDLQGWPPIEVYQVGDVYFVKDGNHRVSVAMEMGLKTIQAYVTECTSPVPLDSTDTAADLILKADRADFLTRTELDRLRPDHNIVVTLPGRYQALLADIAAHQHALEQRAGTQVSWEEATISWYDTVYQPAVRLIEEKGLLREFPHRTAADLYIWIIEYQLELRELCGKPQVNEQVVIEDFADRYSGRPLIAQLKAIRRFLGNLFGRRAPCERL